VDKVITLTGAFKNAGDYLIGHRARALLAAHVDAQVIDVNRREITPAHYELFNSARAVLLTGGPAYQEEIFPKVYSIDLSKIQVPVLAYSLGWKGKLGQQPQDFRFAPEASAFVSQIHSDQTRFSSARDHLTVSMLSANGVNNVSMTGCPAWYDETKLDLDYRFNPDIKRLVLSMPAVPQKQIPSIIRKLAKEFPKAERFISFQAGMNSSHSYWGQKYTEWNHKQLAYGRKFGFTPLDFESDFESFQSFMSTVDFHVGYRVHSHIFTLSQRKSSMLIAEDSRGMGQVAAMGGVALNSFDSRRSIKNAIDELFDTKCAQVEAAVQTMQATHPKMLEFLAQI
jgi:hypothetical protein